MAASFLTLVTATIVAVGSSLNYSMPRISLEFACVVAGLAILIGLPFVSGVFRFFPLVNFPPVGGRRRIAQTSKQCSRRNQNLSVLRAALLAHRVHETAVDLR